jgi:hypothetical protein
VNSELSDATTDVGCSDSKPLCVDSSGSDIGQGFAGAQCIPRPLPCMNNKTGADPDTGCDDYGSEDPICVKDDLTEPASNSPGDQCAPCVNSELSDATTDVGCSDSNPLCVDSNGSSIDPGMAGAQCIKKPDLQFPRNLCENCSKPDALTWLYKPMTGMDLDSAQESKESWVKGSPDDDNTSYVSIVSDKGKMPAPVLSTSPRPTFMSTRIRTPTIVANRLSRRPNTTRPVPCRS